MSGTLFLVATPIGNLGDITLRAIETLKSVHSIACEDTRHTKKLLAHLDIHTPLVSFHAHSGATKLRELVARLERGEFIALVSDSGTPLVSDPGIVLVRRALDVGARVESIPGPTACVSALVASGLPTDRFHFEGFLPRTPGKAKKRVRALATETATLVFYESPYRVTKTLPLLLAELGERQAAIGRELTKKFEEILRGSLTELIEQCGGKALRGECVIVVEGAE